MLFADPPRSLYLILIVATIVAGAVVAKYQTRKPFLIFLMVAGLLLTLFLVDTFVESPREEAVRRVQAMAAAAEAQQSDAFLQHVSPRFDKNGRTRDDLRNSGIWAILRQEKPAVRVWDFAREGYQQISDSELDLFFQAKGENGRSMVLRYCKAKFMLESDGTWKLKTIAFYNPGEGGLRTEDPIPGFP